MKVSADTKGSTLIYILGYKDSKGFCSVIQAYTDKYKAKKARDTSMVIHGDEGYYVEGLLLSN